MARYRRRVSGKFAASAVAAGLVLAAAQGHGHPASGGAAGATLTSADSNVALGQQLASAYGWGSGAEWTCLDELWTRESGWRMVWNYQGSGAYGIPQALPASKMASAGADYMTNPATQIRWGLGYIRSTYGDPCTAWAHEQADSWY
jgi:resuscitation-promoting factor RpfB